MGFVFAVVKHCHSCSSSNGLRILAANHDLGIIENVRQVQNSALHPALLLFGCVIVAVLGQVAELSCGFDLACDVNATAGGEVAMLGGEPIEGGLRKLLYLGHAINATYPRHRLGSCTTPPKIEQNVNRCCHSRPEIPAGRLM